MFALCAKLRRKFSTNSVLWSNDVIMTFTKVSGFALTHRFGTMIASRTLFIAFCFFWRILTAFGGEASYTTILAFVGQEFTTNYGIVFVCIIYLLFTPPPLVLFN